MRILLPLGFLGLIGIAVLILIYLLKPNYQQKVISSTYIWKLSLRYRKKRIPISKLRSLLILLCQILVVVACSFILAHPVTPSGAEVVAAENIAIIDASAGMRASSDGETRFERAVEKTKQLVETTFASSEGKITVIFAGNDPYYLVQRAGAASKSDVLAQLDALIAADGGETACTYARADVDSALLLAQSVVDENPLAQTYFYTGTTYTNPGEVNVVSVAEEGEWNAAVVEAVAVNEDNYFSFEVEVAAYGRDEQYTVTCEVYGANNDRRDYEMIRGGVTCTGDKTQKVVFGADDAEPIYSFDYARISIEANDCYMQDNDYYIYGGRREKMRIQYSTSTSSIFWLSALESLQNSFSARWDFDDPKEVRLDGSTDDEAAALTGFDFYIFEGSMPDELPDFGVIFLVNPEENDSLEADAGLTLGSKVTGKFTLSAGNKHALTAGIDATRIPLSSYTRVISYDAYEPLWYCGEDPALLYKEDFRKEDGIYRTIVVLPFRLQNSDFSIDSFPTLFLNLFRYCLPTTVSNAAGEISNMFEVGESVKLQPRGVECEIENQQISYEKKLEEFEGVFYKPGTYLVKHTVLFETPVETTERIFVKIAAEESNINRVEDSLAGKLIRQEPPDNSLDWLLYLAIALGMFLFAEWLLQAKENF